MTTDQTQEYRIEWTGNIKVYHRVYPQPATVHEVLRETEVACA